MDKSRVAEILNEIGTLLELRGENPFKTRAYTNAARTLEKLGESLEKLVAGKRLGEIKGIGEALERKITELAETGKLAYYDELKASIPPGLIEMLEIPGLGPKKIQVLNQKLGVDSVAKLESACHSGKVADLDGFGEKTQTNLLEGIARRPRPGGGAHVGLRLMQLVAHRPGDQRRRDAQHEHAAPANRRQQQRRHHRGEQYAALPA